ncbi:hypothetical protein ACFQX7_28985 [Luedemannella flava]
MLVALAVGLIAARLLPRIATVVARPALRAGRLGIGLTAMNLARRPTLTPVFAVLTLVVAVLFGTVLNWDVATRAQADQAAFTTGADRVLTVQADNVSALLTAVRAVDPDGRYAMAAVESTEVGVLAVDAPRLAVSHWDEVYGLPHWDQVAAALHRVRRRRSWSGAISASTSRGDSPPARHRRSAWSWRCRAAPAGPSPSRSGRCWPGGTCTRRPPPGVVRPRPAGWPASRCPRPKLRTYRPARSRPCTGCVPVRPGPPSSTRPRSATGPAGAPASRPRSRCRTSTADRTDWASPSARTPCRKA